jgi:hypothetical protein
VNRKGRKTDGLYYALHRVFFSSLPVAQDFTSSRPNCQAFQSGVEVKLRECDLPPQGVLWGGERERERENLSVFRGLCGRTSGRLERPGK